MSLNVDRHTSTAHRLMHYDGACSSIHGHNMGWEVDLQISFSPDYEENMSIDFKEVSSKIDEVDHAILLNKDDPLAEDREDWTWIDGDQTCPVIGWTRYKSPIHGEVFLFDGDPTVEVLSEWMAYRFTDEYEDVLIADVLTSETEQYSVTRTVSERDYE